MRSSFKFTSLIAILLVASITPHSVNAFAALLGIGARVAAKAAIKAGGKAIAKKAARSVAKKAAVTMAKRGASTMAKKASKSVLKKAGNQIKSQAFKQIKSQAKSMLKQNSQADTLQLEQGEEQEPTPQPPNNPASSQTPPPYTAPAAQEAFVPSYGADVAPSPALALQGPSPVVPTNFLGSPNVYPSAGPVAQPGPISFANNHAGGGFGGGASPYVAVPGYSTQFNGGVPSPGAYAQFDIRAMPSKPQQYQFPQQYPYPQQYQFPQQFPHQPLQRGSPFGFNAPIVDGQCYCPCATQRENMYEPSRQHSAKRKRRPAVRVINLGDADDLSNALIAAGIDLPPYSIQNTLTSTLIEG